MKERKAFYHITDGKSRHKDMEKIIELTAEELRKINQDFLAMGYNGDYISGQIVGEIVVLQYLSNGREFDAQYDACILA